MFDTDDMEMESDSIMSQVLDEIGIDIGGQVQWPRLALKTTSCYYDSVYFVAAMGEPVWRPLLCDSVFLSWPVVWRLRALP